jgi:hypothetical protein
MQTLLIPILSRRHSGTNADHCQNITRETYLAGIAIHKTRTAKPSSKSGQTTDLCTAPSIRSSRPRTCTVRRRMSNGPCYDSPKNMETRNQNLKVFRLTLPRPHTPILQYSITPPPHGPKYAPFSGMTDIGLEPPTPSRNDCWDTLFKQTEVCHRAGEPPALATRQRRHPAGRLRCK